MFAPPPNSIIDDNGHILPEVLAGAPPRCVVRRRQRANRSHEVDTIESIMKTGFWPDTFSTDWNAIAARRE